MMLLLLICAVLQMVSGTHGASSSGAMMNMATIRELDVVCDKAGMTVTIDFSQPFNGIIFSKGYYSDPACRYVSEQQNRASYTFDISSNGCGTGREGDKERTSIYNTIIIQFDPLVQEVWDTARRLSCTWRDNYSKQVNFAPIRVSMLDVLQTEFRGDEVKCWMDIRQGIYPNTQPLKGILPIGEPVSVIVFLEDERNRMDMVARDCWAMPRNDEGALEDPNIPRIQLTSYDGCPMKEKLMKGWTRTYDIIDSKRTLVTYAILSAFKFPDYSQVYISCNVEICQSECERECDEISTVDIIPKITQETINVVPQKPFRFLPQEPRRVEPEEPKSVIIQKPVSVVPQQPLRFAPQEPVRVLPQEPVIVVPQEPLRLEPQEPIRFVPQEPARVVPQEPLGVISKEPFRNIPQIPETVATQEPKRIKPQNPKYFVSKETTRYVPGEPETLRPKISDRLVPHETITNLSQPPIRKISETPNTVAPKEPLKVGPQRVVQQELTDVIPENSIQITPQNPIRIITDKPRRIVPQTPLRIIPQKPVRIIPQEPIRMVPLQPIREEPQLPFKPPNYNCRPGSSDPRCIMNPLPLTCTPGTNDPQCTAYVKEKQRKKQCEFGSTEPECLPPVPICFPGSNDPRCSRNEIPFGICREGSNDPRCTQSQIEIPRPNCFPGSNDPRCVSDVSENLCDEKSTDVRCNPISYEPSIPQFPAVDICQLDPLNPACSPVEEVNEIPFDCQNNPNDPRCGYLPPSPVKEDCPPGTRDPKCSDRFIPDEFPRTHSIPKICFPNSKDPECAGVHVIKIKPYTIKIPDTPFEIFCPPYSTDPLCRESPENIKCILNPDSSECITQSTVSSCEFGSKDPKCTQSHRESTFQTKPTSKPYIPEPTTPIEDQPEIVKCMPGSRNPRCPQVPVVPVNYNNCEEDSTSLGCKDKIKTQKQPPPVLDVTLKPKQYVPVIPGLPETTADVAPQCSPDSNDSRCQNKKEKDTKEFSCRDNPFDVRCIKRRTTERPEYISKKEKVPLDCENGLNDPRCTKPINIIPASPELCTPGSENTLGCREVKDICFPGSTNPNCREREITRPAPDQPHLKCDKDNTDPRCIAISELPLVKPAKSTPCVPGSNDIDCIPSVPEAQIPECSPFSDNPRCQESFLPNNPEFPEVSVFISKQDDCLINPDYPGCESVPERPIKIDDCLPGSINPDCYENPPIECLLGAKTSRCHNWNKRRNKPPAPNAPSGPENVRPTIPQVTRSTTERPTSYVPRTSTKVRPQFPPKSPYLPPNLPRVTDNPIRETVTVPNYPDIPSQVSIRPSTPARYVPPKLPEYLLETTTSATTTEPPPILFSTSTIILPTTKATREKQYIQPRFPPEAPGISRVSPKIEEQISSYTTPKENIVTRPINRITPRGFVTTPRGTTRSSTVKPTSTTPQYPRRIPTVPLKTNPPVIPYKLKEPDTPFLFEVTPVSIEFDSNEPFVPKVEDKVQTELKQRDSGEIQRVSSIIPRIPARPNVSITSKYTDLSTEASVPRFPPLPITTKLYRTTGSTTPSSFSQSKTITQTPKVSRNSSITERVTSRTRITRPTVSYAEVPPIRSQTLDTKSPRYSEETTTPTYVEQITTPRTFTRPTVPGYSRTTAVYPPTVPSAQFTRRQRTRRPLTPIIPFKTSTVQPISPPTPQLNTEPSVVPSSYSPPRSPEVTTPRTTVTQRRFTIPRSTTYETTQRRITQSRRTRPTTTEITYRRSTTPRTFAQQTTPLQNKVPNPKYTTEKIETFPPTLVVTTRSKTRPTTDRTIDTLRDIPSRKVSRPVRPFDRQPSFPPQVPGVQPRLPEIQPQLERGESRVSPRPPEILTTTSNKKRRPQPSKVMMHGKDDFHGKGMDPRYHAFHSWLFRPAPRPRTLTRTRRELPETSMMISFGGKKLDVSGEDEVDSAVGELMGPEFLDENYYTFTDVEARVEEVPLDYNDDFVYNIANTKNNIIEGKPLQNSKDFVEFTDSTMSSVLFILGSSSVILIVIALIVITSGKLMKSNKKCPT